MSAGQERKTSPWAWFAAGCLAMVVILVAVVGLGIFSVVRWGKNLAEEQSDPNRREAKARAVLGVERLPEGYHAVTAISIPFLADIAMLSDAPPAAGKPEAKDMGQHGLIYIRFLKVGTNLQEVEDYLSGKTNDPEVLSRNHINIKVSEVLRRGVIEGNPRLLYLVQRGDVNFQGTDSGVRLVTLVLPRCEGGGKMPVALWYGPNVEGAKADDPASLAGTNGDIAEIEPFMRQFKLCE